MELNRVVDEEEDDRRPRRGRRDRTRWDWDRICSYRTPKVVRIKDKFLGAMYWSVVTASIMYIIIYVFHIEGKHSEQGTGIGTVITKFQGKGFAGDKVFDGADLRFPVIEPSGAFIMTRRIVVQNQTQGNCVDWDNPQKCPCPANSTCNDGYCEVRAWCPSIGDYNTGSPPSGALIENITGLEDSILKIASAIAFPSIGNKFFVTGSSPSATDKFKSIKLGALLKLADPPIDLKDLPHGALIGVSFFWKCNVVNDCEPTAIVKRLDGGQGFQQKRSQIKRVDGHEVREAMYMFGLRILVDSSGIGQRISWNLIVIQIGSCLALLRVASLLVDFIMLMLPHGRQEAYHRCKVLQTRHYSELQDRLNLITDLPPVDRQRLGAHQNLGLRLARASSPGTILRGRSPAEL